MKKIMPILYTFGIAMLAIALFTATTIIESKPAVIAESAKPEVQPEAMPTINIKIKDEPYVIRELDAETAGLRIKAVQANWEPFIEYTEEESDSCDWTPVLIARDNTVETLEEQENFWEPTDKYENYYANAAAILGSSYGVDYLHDGELAQDICTRNLDDYEFITMWVETHDGDKEVYDNIYTIENLEDAFGPECGPYIHLYMVDFDGEILSHPRELTNALIGKYGTHTVAMFSGKIAHLLIVCEHSDARWNLPID